MRDIIAVDGEKLVEPVHGVGVGRIRAIGPVPRRVGRRLRDDLRGRIIPERPGLVVRRPRRVMRKARQTRGRVSRESSALTYDFDLEKHSDPESAKLEDSKARILTIFVIPYVPRIVSPLSPVTSAYFDVQPKPSRKTDSP